MISRRVFLLLTGGALIAPSFSWAANEVPIVLDHILLGCNDLQRGITFVEERTGVRATFGGVHPGRGTQNALLSLGARHYLEIIAPDPKQNQAKSSGAPQFAQIKDFAEPRLIGWASHPGDLQAFAKKLRAAGIAFTGPTPGSRARPDGRLLHWKTLNLADDHHGVLPFFIEWSSGSVHPSADAPQGCRMETFAIADPDPAALMKILQQLSLDAPVERGDHSQLRTRITGPRGTLEISS
jgi:catechol 2,3-dioxygenase-like lactoylglutathione lyase family enzyme